MNKLYAAGNAASLLSFTPLPAAQQSQGNSAFSNTYHPSIITNQSLPVNCTSMNTSKTNKMVLNFFVINYRRFAGNAVSTVLMRTILIILLAISGLKGWSQVITFNFTGLTSSASAWTTTSLLNQGITLTTGVSRGAGLSSTTTGNRFSTTSSFGFNGVTSLTSSINNNNYITFTITPESGYSLNLQGSTISFTIQASNTGVTNCGLFSSIDGFAAANILQNSSGLQGSTTPITYTFGAGSQYANITTAISFRLYGYATSGGQSAGTFSLNAMSVNSVVNPPAQSLPYTQNFGTTAFTSYPTGFAGLVQDGTTTTTQSAALATAPTNTAPLLTPAGYTGNAFTAEPSGGLYAFVTSSNGRLGIATSNSVTGLNQPVLAINTGAGVTSISFAYDISVLYAASGYRTMGIELEYRQGTTGSWTSVSGSSVSYTAGGSTPSGSTSRSLTVSGLSASTTYQFRWASWRNQASGTTNVSVGLDNISIAASAATATQIAINAGNNQTAIAGANVTTAPSVIVKDASNNPVSGVSVTFAVASGGGSATGLTATTNASGIATVGSWTLGTTAGTNTLTATSGSLSGSPVTFTATGIAGAATQIAINAGNNQTATAGSAVATLPSVIVKDANNNVVSGVSVTFAVGSGGGSATVLSATTNVSGIATVGSWTLGTTAGTNTLTASSTGLAGSPLTFTATGTAGVATQIAVNAGNNQTASVNTAVTTAPGVIVKDVNDNPVSGVSVTFAVASGGGSITGAIATTNTSGIATVGSWTMGASAGSNTLTATSASLAGSPITFTATATGATQIAINAGNNQTTTAGSAVAILPSVIVRDAGNNPVAGVTVTFAVASGGGSATGLTATSDASGVATLGSWTLGATAGTNTLTATSGTLTGSPITFTATGIAGTATQIAINAGNNQSVPAGTAVPILPSVIVRDVNNNVVSGVSVTFAVAIGGGSATGLTATTNASGIATVGSWTLGTSLGSNTLAATSAGLTGSPVTFTATGTAGAATQITINAGNNQTATAGTAVVTLPSVIIKDVNNNPVSGVSVTFAVASGGGSITGATATTNTSGIATVGSWTLGATAGTNTLTATSGSLAGSPITFTATGTAGAATQISINAGNNQSAIAGTAVTTTPSVIVRDVNNNVVSGITVTFAVATGGGSATGLTATTNAGGIASVGTWTLGTTAGSNTLTATSTGLTGSPITFTATGIAGAASAVQSTLTPVNASIVANGTSTQVLTVRAKDANGNNLTAGGATVTIARSSGTGTIGSVTDNANGTYTATVTAPVGTGSGVFVATLGGAAVQSGSASQTQSTITYLPIPVITTSVTSLAAFSTTAGTASTAQAFTVSGTNLVANILVTPPTGYEVSQTSATAGFAAAQTLTASGGVVSGTIYVRLTSTATAGFYSGNVALTSTSATTVNVSVSGTVNAVSSGFIAGWDFTTTTTGGTASQTSPSTPLLFNANFGTGTIYLDGTNGSSTWLQASELTAFGGTSTVNTASGFSTSTATGTSLSPLGGTSQSANGKSIVFKFNMTNYKDLVVTYAAQRTSTGFSTHQWDYSTNGTTWITGQTETITATAFALTTLTTVTNLDGAATAYLRLTVNGATSSGGNNRLDNFQLNATPASTPAIIAGGGPITGLTTTYGTASSPTSFALSGTNLSTTISIAALAGFEFSISAGGTGTYTSTLTGISATGPTTVYVRLAANASVGTHSGNIVASSGSTTLNVPMATSTVNGLPISVADFRSRADGNFSIPATWEYDQGGGSWVAATAAPTSSNDVDIYYTVTLDQNYTVGAGKRLQIRTESPNPGSLIIGPTANLAMTDATSAINFNGRPVTVKSTAAGTGTIGKMLGSLTNATKVTVERFIPDNGNRAWRLLAVPTSGQTIKEAWQENQTNNGNTISNTNPGYGTQITGVFGTQALAQGQGFDDNTPSSSLLTYNATANTLPAVINTSTKPFASEPGYFIYIRGDRTVTKSASTGDVTATTLRSTGAIRQGTQTTTVTAAQRSLIGNPFASAIDLTNITITGGFAGTTFRVWDPKLSTLGGYQTLTLATTGANAGQYTINPGGGSYPAPGSVINTIQSGQAFFATATAAGTIIINENSKVSGSTQVFRPSAPTVTDQRFFANLNSVSSGGDRVLDGIYISLDNSHSNAIDNFDSRKQSNFTENLSMRKQDISLTVEKRQPFSDNDTVFFNLSSLRQVAYQLYFKTDNLDANLVATLEDTYLNTKTLVNPNGNSTYNFSVDANAGSSAANRFRVVFKELGAGPLPVTFTSIKAAQQNNDIAVEWKVASQLNIARYEVEKSVNGRDFIKVANVEAASATVYNWLDVSAVQGTNFYRIRAIDNNVTYKYTQVVKVTLGKKGSAITVSPNPVQGNIVNLQFTNQLAGKYRINLTNAAGQLMYTNILQHGGGSSFQTITLSSQIIRGVYQLEVVAPDKTRRAQKLILN